MNTRKLEFMPMAGKHPAYFLVPAGILDAFIKFLNSKRVFVHAPIACLTDGFGEHFEVPVNEGIPPQDGESLVMEFLAQPPQQ